MSKSNTMRTCFDITYREDIEQVIRELNPIEYAYIKHDSDVLIDGQPKKTHYHIWCRFDTPVRKTMVAKALGLNDSHIPCTAKSQKACIRYMTHETKEAIKMKKHKYSRDEIVSNLEKDEIARIYMIDDCQGDNIMQVMEMIRTYYSFEELMFDLVQCDLIDTYNKYYNSIFRRLVNKWQPDWKPRNE